MRPKWVGFATLAAAFALAAPAALAAHSTARATSLPRGDLVIIFSGTGAGSYHFHQPPQGAGSACHVADTTYGETDTYRWSYRFVVPPTGGSSDTPFGLTASGQIASTEQLLQCAGDASVSTSCTQLLHVPGPNNGADLAYPGVTVSLIGVVSLTSARWASLLRRRRSRRAGGACVLLANPLPVVLAAAGSRSRLRVPALAASGDVAPLHDRRLRSLRRPATRRELRLEHLRHDQLQHLRDEATPTARASWARYEGELQRHDRSSCRQVASARARAAGTELVRVGRDDGTAHAPGEGLERAVAAQVDATRSWRPRAPGPASSSRAAT